MHCFTRGQGSLRARRGLVPTHANLTQLPEHTCERETGENAQGYAGLRRQGPGRAQQGDTKARPAAKQGAGTGQHRHRARPRGQQAPESTGHNEVAHDEEDTHGRRGCDDDGTERGVEGDVDPGDGDATDARSLAVEGHGDLGAPGGQQEQARYGQDRGAGPHPRGRNVEEAPEHEGFELTGHVTDAQGDDDTQGEEGGQQDGGGGLGGAWLARGRRQGGGNERRTYGTAGNDGVAPAHGHAHHDAGEDAVHHVHERRGRPRRQGQQP